MNLVDDVGGIGGFCKFLETINGNNLEEKRSYKTWANSLLNLRKMLLLDH